MHRAQLEYMELRLIARKANKIKFGNNKEAIAQLELKISEAKKILGIKEITKKVKVELDGKGVLESRIKKLEQTLSNEGFLSKVTKEVIEIKKKELESLVTELENY